MKRIAIVSLVLSASAALAVAQSNPLYIQFRPICRQRGSVQTGPGTGAARRRPYHAPHLEPPGPPRYHGTGEARLPRSCHESPIRQQRSLCRVGRQRPRRQVGSRVLEEATRHHEGPPPRRKRRRTDDELLPSRRRDGACLLPGTRQAGPVREGSGQPSARRWDHFSRCAPGQSRAGPARPQSGGLERI